MAVNEDSELHWEVDKILRAAGCTPDRSVDPARWTGVLELEGYRLPPAAVGILKRFGGLSITPPSRPGADLQCDTFHFDPVDAAGGENDRFEEWQVLAGRELSPIGAVADWILCVDDEGQFYIGSHGDLELLGHLARALEYLMLGNGEPRRLGPKS